MLFPVHSIGCRDGLGGGSADGRMSAGRRAAEKIAERSAAKPRLERQYLALMSRELRIVIIADVQLLALPVLH